MNVLAKILLGLLMAGLLPTHSLAQSEVIEEARSTQILVDTLETNIKTLQLLIAKIETEKTESNTGADRIHLRSRYRPALDKDRGLLDRLLGHHA